MSRPVKLKLPLRNGVAASVLACPPGHWPTLLGFLIERLPGVAPDIWRQRLEQGELLDERGQVLLPDAPYRAGGRVHYWRSLAQEAKVPFEARILFQDELLLVADKPHFLPVLPSGRYVQETLLTRMRQATGLADLSPIHRIDRETAGLVVFSLQPATRGAYQALFRDRAVHKVYEAVAGLPEPLGLRLPLTRRSRLQERSEAFMQMEEVPGEPNAETQVELLQRHSTLPLARYRLCPSTGQKHQLRAHMNALGLPLLGDRIYPQLLPPEPIDAPDFREPLQLLALSLSFLDPISGQKRKFESAQRLMPFL